MADQPSKEGREFAAFLLDRPATHAELTAALQTLTKRVVETGKGGSITLTLSIKPFKGDDKVMTVSDAVRVKLPEHDRKEGIFYPDSEGNLTRNDPTAMDWSSLRDVPDVTEQRTPKEV